VVNTSTSLPAHDNYECVVVMRIRVSGVGKNGERKTQKPDDRTTNQIHISYREQDIIK
jgi:hypothetical protein